MSSVFILGATGFIGGALIFKMKQENPELQVTALVRDPADAKALKDIGVIVELGDTNDLCKVVDLVSKADIVINAALCDSIPLVQAILTGQRIHSQTGRSTLLHLSHSVHSLCQEEPHFLQLQTTTFDDENLEWLAMLSDDNSNSALVDREIMEDSRDCPIFAFIVAPTTVFGDAPRVTPRKSHELFDLVRCAVAERYMLFPGDGRNAGNGIHLQSLLELLMSILRRAYSSALWQSEHTQFFFASGSAFHWSQVAEKIARVLYSRGVVDSAQVYSCSPDLYPELRRFTNNYAVEPLRAQSSGLRWSPNSNQELAIVNELEHEVDSFLAEISMAEA